MTATALGVAALLDEGRLAQAQAVLAARLRAAPGDAIARRLYAELLCLEGALDRADRQFDLLSTTDSASALRAARLRQLIRGEQARRAWFAEGALPVLMSEPGERLHAALALGVASRAGEAAAIAAGLEVQAALPDLAGTLDGAPFAVLRDLDDRTALVLEGLTAEGDYLWLDWAEVARLRLHPVKHPIDLLWRQAALVLRDGRGASLAVPAPFPPRGGAGEGPRRGRQPDWPARPGRRVVGQGQRCLLAADDVRGMLDFGEITVTAAA